MEYKRKDEWKKENIEMKVVRKRSGEKNPNWRCGL